MDEEIKNLLRQNLEVSEGIFALLRKMRREVIWSRIFHGVKWAIILAAVIFGFVKLQPFLAYWIEVFANISAGIEKLNRLFPGR